MVEPYLLSASIPAQHTNFRHRTKGVTSMTYRVRTVTALNLRLGVRGHEKLPIGGHETAR
jgi:hypothetical protein